MILKLIIDIEELNVSELSHILTLLNNYNTEDCLVELLVMSVERYCNSLPLEFNEDLGVTFYNMLTNGIESEIQDYISNKVIISISEYVSFFENHITIKTLLGEIREKIEGMDYSITSYEYSMYDTRLVLNVKLDKDEYY